MGDLQLKALGRLEVRRDETPVVLRRSTEKSLVAALIAAGPEGLTVSEISRDLEEAGGTASEPAVRQALYRLTKKLPEIRNTTGAYRLDVPLRAVDSWHFKASVRGSPDAVLSHLEGWSDEPFADVDPTLRVHCEREQLREFRVEALRRLAADIGRSSSDQFPLLLRSIDAEPYQEDLVAAVAKALHRCGRSQQALDLIRTCRRRFLDDLGLDTGPLLDDTELAVLRNELTPSPSVVHIDQRQQTVPQQKNPRFVGRQADLRELIEIAASAAAGPGRIIVLEAGAGQGKSALMEEFAARLDPDQAVLRIGRATRSDDVALAALLQALPELGQAAESLLAHEDPAIGRLLLARSVERALGAFGQKGLTVMLLDDMHECDPETASLLRYLGSVVMPRNVVVVIGARPAATGSHWAPALASICEKRMNQRRVLPPLSQNEVLELVRLDHADTDGMVQLRLADRVLDGSGGNALVATRMLRAARAQPLRWLDRQPSESTPDDAVLAYLDHLLPPDDLDLLSLAALLGLTFSAETLSTLAERSIVETLERLDVARRADLIVEVENDHFRFDHALTQATLASRFSSSRKRRVFATLVRLSSPSPQERMRYVGAAGDLVPPDEGLEILSACARSLERSQAFPAAAEAFELAADLAPPEGSEFFELAVGAATCWTRAGAIEAGRTWRARAVEAVRDEDPDRLCRVAMAGLPAGVATGGDSDRLEILRRIDLERVTAFPLREIRRNMLNQARMLNDKQAFERLMALGHDTSDEPALRAHHLVNAAIGPAPPPIADELDALVRAAPDGPERTSLLIHQLWASLAEQRANAAFEHFDETAAEVRRHPSPRHVWSIHAIDAALNQVGMRTSGATPARALETGLRLGVPDAFDGWAAQQFVGLWLSGRLDEALETIDAAGPSMRKNVAWRGVSSLAAAAAGDADRSRRETSQVLTEIETQSAVVWTPVAAAAVVEAAARTQDVDAAARAAEVLQPRSGQALIVGLGVAHLGPVDRFLGLASAKTDPRLALSLLQSARSQASESGASVWAELSERNIQEVSA